jgi:hypothetical protein
MDHYKGLNKDNSTVKFQSDSEEEDPLTGKLLD